MTDSAAAKIESWAWQHKKAKYITRVFRWWEMESPMLDSKDGDIPGITKAWKIGALVQIGWLMQTSHGIFIGVSDAARKEFEELGPWDDKVHGPKFKDVNIRKQKKRRKKK